MQAQNRRQLRRRSVRRPTSKQADIHPTSIVHIPAIDVVVAGDAVYNEIHPMLGLATPDEWQERRPEESGPPRRLGFARPLTEAQLVAPRSRGHLVGNSRRPAITDLAIPARAVVPPRSRSECGS